MKTKLLTTVILMTMVFACKKTSKDVGKSPSNIPQNAIQKVSSNEVNVPSFAKISPLISSILPNYKYWEINPLRETKLIFSSGSRIFIPKNAFVNEKGESIKENVNIAYREFHDAADILLAGIPMEIQLDKNVKNLETAGMYEILAEVNGKKVELAPGKKIKVEMRSYQKGNDYDMYYFEEGREGWKKIGKPSTFSTLNLAKTEAAKEKASDELFTIPLGDNYFIFNYTDLLDMTLLELQGDSTINWDDWWKANTDVKLGKSPVIVAKAQQYGFHWYDVHCDVAVSYQGNAYPAGMVLWKYHEGVRIPDWLNGNYKVDLQPANNGEPNVYHLVVNKGDKYFDAYIELVMPLRDLYAFPPAYWQTNKEEAMAKIKEEEDRLRKEAGLFRSFEIYKMGIYNCDRIMADKDAFYVKGIFQLPKGKETLGNKEKIFFIPQNNQTVIAYDKNQWDKIALSAKQNARIITVLADGSIGFFSANQYKQIPFEQLKKMETPTYHFAFSATPRKIDSEVDLRALLNL